MAKEVAILGVGMHQWGKWGKDFVEYGVKACNDALADANVKWKDIQVVAGAETVRNGYAGPKLYQLHGHSPANPACPTGDQSHPTGEIKLCRRSLSHCGFPVSNVPWQPGPRHRYPVPIPTRTAQNRQPPVLQCEVRGNHNVPFQQMVHILIAAIQIR